MRYPARGRLTLPGIPLLVCLVMTALLPAGTETIAYMDTERSVKLDAPFLPTPLYVIAEILFKAGVGKDDVLYDLGSGDGRIVIEAARQTGCRAVGIEIDADLVDDSRFNALRAGVQDRVRFVVADLFTEDFSQASVVTLYMGQTVNLRLRPKLLSELRPGTRIASYSFDMGEWKPDAVSTFGREDLYFWVVPANASGRWNWTEGRGKTQVRWQLEIRQSFQEIEGQVRRNGSPVPARFRKIEGSKIRFSVDGNPGGAPTAAEFTGHVRGGTIEGTIAEGSSRRAWKAVRDPATVQPIGR